MQHVGEVSLWRGSFVGALQLLGQATSRLPFGVADPVLCDASAVELYTGGLWPAGDLQVLASETQPLVAQLFAVGFRWTQRPRHLGRGLWHPELRIGADLIEGRTPLGLAERSNLLTVAVDLGLTGPADKEMVWLKAVGIEELIADEAADWLADRAVTGEAATRIRVLAELAQRGVGGRLRAVYLQRRLAWKTNGEVALEALRPEGDIENAPAPRMMTLTAMQTVIGAWHVWRGFSIDQPGSRVARGSGKNRTQAIGYRNDGAGPAGEASFASTNVVPFDVASLVPPG
jgi:hypothetical protein